MTLHGGEHRFVSAGLLHKLNKVVQCLACGHAFCRQGDVNELLNCADAQTPPVFDHLP